MAPIFLKSIDLLVDPLSLTKDKLNYSAIVTIIVKRAGKQLIGYVNLNIRGR